MALPGKEPNLEVTFGGFSSAGNKPENQDAFAAWQPSSNSARYKGIACCIADGVSCSDNAQQASTTSVTHFLNDYYSTPDSWDVKTAAGKVLSSLNAWLYHHGQQASARHNSLVTTLSSVVLKSSTLHVFHVGDSRVYRLRNVLNVLYFATFGSELAVVSMLPLFFAETFTLDPVMAGMVASAYAFMNLMSRPGGGWLSDKFGRKSTLLILTAGLAVGYFIMSLVDSSWPLWLAVVAAMACSFFVQSGEGAVFAAVPLIKRRLTGQIAGMTGAYGNVGAVTYLTVLSFVDYSVFFMVIAATAVVGFITLLFMEEPKGHIAEVREDGSVEMISVN